MVVIVIVAPKALIQLSKVAARSKARTVYARSNTEIVGSNPS
jgi:hypothetical protein